MKNALFTATLAFGAVTYTFPAGTSFTQLFLTKDASGNTVPSNTLEWRCL